MGYAIIACEVGFWVLLGAGLAARYLLRLRRASAVILLAVPVVDVVLLGVAVADLRGGAAPTAGHAIAAVYLGFSVAFGHGLIRWADQRAAHRFAGGPPPPRKPAGGTPERVRKEWHDFGLAVLGYAVTAAIVGVLAASTVHGADRTPLFGSLPGLGIALIVWLVGWPVPETVRAANRARR